MILIKIKYSKFHGNQNEIRNEEVDRLANRGAFLPETVATVHLTSRNGLSPYG